MKKIIIFSLTFLILLILFSLSLRQYDFHGHWGHNTSTTAVIFDFGNYTLTLFTTKGEFLKLNNESFWENAGYYYSDIKIDFILRFIAFIFLFVVFAMFSALKNSVIQICEYWKNRDMIIER